MLQDSPCRFTVGGRGRRPSVTVALSIATVTFALLPGSAGAANKARAASRAARVVQVKNSGTAFHAQRAPITAAGVQASAKALHTSVQAAVAATYCWSWTPWVAGYDLFGIKVWQYNQGLYWCGNGSWITYRAAAHDYPSNTFLGWSFEGNLGYWNIGGTGYNLWEHWNQGHFCLISYFSCVQNSYPWIDSKVYANGYGTARFGG
jgi:hypothetical protein